MINVLKGLYRFFRKPNNEQKTYSVGVLSALVNYESDTVLIFGKECITADDRPYRLLITDVKSFDVKSKRLIYPANIKHTWSLSKIEVPIAMKELMDSAIGGGIPDDHCKNLLTFVTKSIKLIGE